MISLWEDQTSFIASGVPIPAPLGSPDGPNLSYPPISADKHQQTSHEI